MNERIPIYMYKCENEWCEELSYSTTLKEKNFNDVCPCGGKIIETIDDYEEG